MILATASTIKTYVCYNSRISSLHTSPCNSSPHPSLQQLSTPQLSTHLPTTALHTPPYNSSPHPSLQQLSTPQLSTHLPTTALHTPPYNSSPHHSSPHTSLQQLSTPLPATALHTPLPAAIVHTHITRCDSSTTITILSYKCSCALHLRRIFPHHASLLIETGKSFTNNFTFVHLFSVSAYNTPSLLCSCASQTTVQCTL
jgi:hypothetical protein